MICYCNKMEATTPKYSKASMIERTTNLDWTFTRLVALALFLWVALKLASLNFVWLPSLGPSGLTTTVQSVGIHHESLAEGLPSDNVGFRVRNVAVKDLRRGFVASNSKDDPTKEAANLTARSLSRITMAKLEMVMSHSLAATPLTLR
ncbi:hypothetical protein VitviT2T_026638 [Vitis vinifera]|uniref:Uncharacterized protein n=1 Tax=Vitis vinifera TaxID=29760 RepID=A0ABY9DMJ4_VITVI|nr:hypothetical protein VitviT2T_026638 [Vitis vinifera]